MKIIEQYTELDESSLTRWLKHVEEHDCASITAYRREYSHKENQQRNINLVQKIRAAGYQYVGVMGSYVEKRGQTPENQKPSLEHVYFVIDWKDSKHLEQDLCVWGEEFEQESVLFIPKGGKEGHIIGTSDDPDNDPPYGETRVLNYRQFGKEDYDFLTYVDGRPMYFKAEKITEIKFAGTNMGRWGASLQASKHWSKMEIREAQNEDH